MRYLFLTTDKKKGTHLTILRWKTHFDPEKINK